MAKQAKKLKRWSYCAGEPGTNWVRAYEHARDGKLLAEWFDLVEDNETGELARVRRRVSLHKQGVTTRAAAVEKVEKMAERVGELVVSVLEQETGPLSLRQLLRHY